VARSKPIPASDQYDNGKVRFRGANLDGKMHGPWKFFRRDGSLMRSGSFDRGTQIGVWRTYDRTGNVIKETDFSRAKSRTPASVRSGRPRHSRARRR
jgi:antitoxin component YwqK of YwqJK toxin-antitoxin module